VNYYDCSYQAPPSIFVRTLARYLAYSDSIFTRSPQSLMSLSPVSASFPSRTSGVPEEIEHIPLAAAKSPGPFFEDVFIDWEVCRADARCIPWVLHSTTDTNIILSIQFPTDITWYPKTARALPPHVLADLFLGYLPNGRVVTGRLEHANSIGMALASVLGIQLCVELGREYLRELCGTHYYHSKRVLSSEPTFLQGV
ncbi:hypothetical protein BDM02DRAFT_3121396, partial [Thelephora ganbajun]